MVNGVEDAHGKSSRIFVSGGFTYSSEWVQLLSDILNRELIHAETGDASVLGAAMMGFEAFGQKLNIKSSELRIYTPEGSHSHVFSAHYEQFQALYSNLELLFNRYSSN
jgi:gluconokinase